MDRIEFFGWVNTDELRFETKCSAAHLVGAEIIQRGSENQEFVENSLNNLKINRNLC